MRYPNVSEHTYVGNKGSSDNLHPQTLGKFRSTQKLFFLQSLQNLSCICALEGRAPYLGSVPDRHDQESLSPHHITTVPLSGFQLRNNLHSESLYFEFSDSEDGYATSQRFHLRSN